MRMRAENSFTIMELILVVVILGMIASLAVLNYRKATRHAAEQDAVLRLNTIAAFVKIYHSKYGHFPPVMNGIAEINSTLGSNLTDTDKLTFSCPNDYGNDSACKAVSFWGWSVHFENNYLNYTPHCLSDHEGGDACPTCDQTGCF